MTDPLSRLTAALADRYRIERELGQGGMATVYLAEDLRHHRKVAIKVLREDLAASMGAPRFLREIQIAAQLQHPNILPLLDSGEGSGFLFYVMPYIAGHSLRERIDREGELPVSEAVRLITEVVDALAEAHEHGVVHRDVKPDNVMLSGRHALVTDFGVAKAVSEATGGNLLTTLGVAIGTPAYMSPEQAAADPHIDHRSDIYAVGVMAYELLTGRTPFVGGTPQQVLAAHVTEAPEAVSRRRPAIPPTLDAVIMRCLAKRPADRFQTAAELLAQLEPLATPSGGITPTSTEPVSAAREPVASGRGLPRWAPPAIALLLVAGAGYGLIRAWPAGRGGGGTESVAVLPFENVGGDSANRSFTDGIQSEILTDLTRIASLQVTSRSSVLEYRNTTKPVKQIGAELGVRNLLQGQVQRAGTQVHVTVQLVNAPTDRQIWAESYDRELTAQNVFTIQGDIARNVAEALRANFSATEAAAAQQAPTDNLEALDWYHRGTDLFADRSGSFNDTASVHAFERAVALDSGFAEAWAGLASARSWLVRDGVTVDTLPARSALNRAISLDPSSPQTQIAEAYYEYYARGDFDAAQTHFKAVAALQPSNAEAVAGIGYIARRQGRWDEAIGAGQQVMRLDPRSAGAISDLAGTYLALRRYDEAEAALHRALILDPHSVGITVYLYESTVVGRGDTATGRTILASLPDEFSRRGRAIMGYTQARYRRDFAASNAALAQSVPTRDLDVPADLVDRALNLVAGGDVDGARLLADSAARVARSHLATTTGAGVFGYRADFLTVLGVAEAILGQSTDAVRDGERAVQLNPIAHDAMEGPRSQEALIAIHLLLGHRDEAIRLITAEAHQPLGSTSVMPLTRASIRLDPIFDGIRPDPRIQALLKDDAAWVVH